jgi:hypothetical protein
MTLHAPRLPATLDPLIAEAKQRAKQRRFLFAVALALVVGGSAAAIIASRPAVATGPRPTGSAVVASDFGMSLVQARGPVGVFAPRFGIAVVVGNGSAEPVVLERVRMTLGARHSPVEQIGTRFTPWKNAKGCATGDFPICATRPIEARRPSPLRLAPGHQALVQLNFRLLTCTLRPIPEALSLEKITAVYRLPDGTQIDQQPPLLAGYGYPTRVRGLGSLPNNQAFAPLGGITTFGKVTTRACNH